jgi:hypothetical protein
MGVYSFINVQASIVGPGGNVNLGYGSGSAEEGITVEMSDDKGVSVAGADGQIMQTLRASNLGRISVRLLKTSPLSQMYNTQKTISGLWGNNTIRVTDVSRGDVVVGTTIAFTKLPTIVYGKDGNMNEWTFVGNVDETLGTGTPVAA